MTELNNGASARRPFNPLQHSLRSPVRPMATMSGRPKGQKTFDAHAYRAVVWILVAIAAITVWFAAPSGGTASDWSSDVSIAEIGKAANDASTQGAPQQQVVNGWFVAATIPILSEQVSALHTTMHSGRIPGLMLVFGLGYCADVVGRSLVSASLRRQPESGSGATATATVVASEA